MTASCTANLLDRPPLRPSAQATGMDEQALKRQERDANDRKLAFLCAVEVMDSGWEVWRDTLAAFHAASATCERTNA